MLTKNEALKLIKTISTRGARMEKYIQTALVTACFYSIAHGDVTIGQAVIDGWPVGSRKAAAVSFLETYGQFEVKGKEVVYHKDVDLFKMHGNEAQAEEFCASIDVFWTSLKPETVKSKFDLDVVLVNFVKRAEKEIKAGNAEHSELFEPIRQALAVYHRDENHEEVTDNDEADILAEALSLDNDQQMKLMQKLADGLGYDLNVPEVPVLIQQAA